MAINIIQGFNPSTTEPIDSRIVKANAAARFSIPTFGAYNGLIVYQEDDKQLYVLIDINNIGLSLGWKLLDSPTGNFTGSFSGSFSGSFNGDGSGLTNLPFIGHQISTGSVSASLNTIGDLFLIKSASAEFISITSTTTIITNDIFIIKNNNNIPVYTISESIVYLATQSAELTGPTIAGGMYFTSSSFYVGLEN
jgi:hypothetical protein